MKESPPRISAAIITYNEEKNIKDCLESVLFADEIVVVDSYSSDKTEEIAKHFPVHFLKRKFDNFSGQKNYALSQTTGEWVLLIDADERVSPKLQGEIQALLASDPPPAAYRIKRESYFFGKPLRYSGTQKDAPIRLFPRSSVRYEQPIHEEIVTSLPVRHLQSRILHFSTENAARYNQKLRPYISLEIQNLKINKKPVTWIDVLGRPLARFFQRLIPQAGLLDGLTGLFFAYHSARYEFKKWNGYLKEKKSQAQAEVDRSPGT